LKVGFTWSGSVFDRTRNALLQDFLGLLSLDVPLVSLQKDVDVLEARLLTEVGVHNNGSSFRHFGDTRDAIDDLDAVVTVDTAVAHLAGAMAKPTWLLLNEPAAVRWMTNRADTPWYPTMHICRRHKGDLWAQLVAVAASEVLHP
jgi:ADP-heptose:LPS heptosyltransferase